MPFRRSACRHADTTSLTVRLYTSAQSGGRSTTAAADSGSSYRTSAGPSSSSSAGSIRWSTSTACPRCRRNLSACERRGLVEEEIGNEDDQPAPAELLDHAPERRRRGGPVARRRGRERRDDPEPVCTARLRGQDGADGLVEDHEPGGVTLPHQHQRERGGEAAGVVEFREAGVGRARPGHRAAGVEHHHGAEVGLFLELLDVQPVLRAQQLPVDVAELVARLVHPVLGELDRESAPGRAMAARPGTPRRALRSRPPGRRVGIPRRDRAGRAGRRRGWWPCGRQRTGERQGKSTRVQCVPEG